MTQKEKLHERIKNNPVNVRFDDAVTWLHSWGFIQSGGKGSHTAFIHPDYDGKTYFSECQWNGESIPDQTGVESDKGNGP